MVTQGDPITLYNSFSMLEFGRIRMEKYIGGVKCINCKAHYFGNNAKIESSATRQEHTHQDNISTPLVRLAAAPTKERMGEASATPAAVLGIVSTNGTSIAPIAFERRNATIFSASRLMYGTVKITHLFIFAA